MEDASTEAPTLTVVMDALTPQGIRTPVVRLDVSPRLLQDALERLLAAAGVAVTPAGRGPRGEVDLLIVSEPPPSRTAAELVIHLTETTDGEVVGVVLGTSDPLVHLNGLTGIFDFVARWVAALAPVHHHDVPPGAPPD